MNNNPLQYGIRYGTLNLRRTINFNARRLRSAESHSKYYHPLIAPRISLSNLVSRVNILRHHSTTASNEKRGNYTSNKKNESIVGNIASEAGSPAKVYVTEPLVHQSPNIESPLSKPEPSSEDFLTTIFENLEPYIDTYDVYKRLLESGFTPSQADEIINLLIFQLNSKLSKLLTIYSQLYELENEQYLFESAQQELHVDITRNREQHISDAINQINAMERDYGIISDELNNHFIQMKNDIQVAINDQKSENTLMSKRIMLRMQETNHKITTELNMAMRLEIESLRWHLSRWGLIAILMSIVTACAGFYIYRSRHQKQLTEKNEFVPLVIYEPSEFDEDDYHADLDPNAL